MWPNKKSKLYSYLERIGDGFLREGRAKQKLTESMIKKKKTHLWDLAMVVDQCL
jgi:hypothetical protein